MRQNRARTIGTRVRISTHEIEYFNGMRPFHAKRFGRIIGHVVESKKITTYTVVTDEESTYTLSREQFATSALEKSFKYRPKNRG